MSFLNSGLVPRRGGMKKRPHAWYQGRAHLELGWALRSRFKAKLTPPNQDELAAIRAGTPARS